MCRSDTIELAGIAGVGVGEFVTIESHKEAMRLQWNRALDIAAEIVSECGHVSADLAAQRISARKAVS